MIKINCIKIEVSYIVELMNSKEYCNGLTTYIELELELL